MIPTANISVTPVSERESLSAMQILFQKLDEAIDDMEQGRVQSIDEAWEEIDKI